MPGQWTQEAHVRCSTVGLPQYRYITHVVDVSVPARSFTATRSSLAKLKQSNGLNIWVGLINIRCLKFENEEIFTIVNS